MEKYTRSHREKYFVSPRDDSWAVSRENRSPVAYVYKEKKKALETAEYLARQNHTEIVVQQDDGSIEEVRSFSK